MLYDVLGRLIAVMIPLNVDCRTGHSYHSQVIRFVRRLLDVQLYQLLVSAINVTCLTHVRTTVVYLDVIDL